MEQRKTKLYPRCLALLLSVVMVVGMLPAAGAASGKNTDPNHQHTDACKTLTCTKKEGDYECDKDGQYEGCPEKDKKQVEHQHNDNCTKKTGDDGKEEYDCNIQYDEIDVDHEHGPSCTVHSHNDSCPKHVHDEDTCYDWHCPADPPPVTDAVTEVRLNQSSATVKIGETVNLTATVAVTGSAAQTVTWNSSDDKIATVSDGKVTAKAAGTATITATSTADSSKKDSCTITVSAPAEAKLSADKLELYLGQSSTLELIQIPDSTASVTWKSSNANIVAVNGNGAVSGSGASRKSSCSISAKSAGTANITVTAGSNTYTCAVTVKGFSLSSTSLTLAVKKTSKLSVSYLPSGYTVEWTSGSSSVSLSAKTGKEITLTGNSATNGSVGITATVKSGSTTVQSLSCKVTVTNAAADDITYSTDGDTPVNFVARDFNDVCNTKDVADKRLDYIYFTNLPSSSYGTLYYKYDEGTKKGTAVKASSSEKYYYESGSKSDRLIEDLTFVPKSADDRTVALSYTGCAINGTEFSGQVKITIGASGDLVYSISKNGTLELDADDFASFFKKESSSSTGLSYIIFDALPGSSKGTLYFKYDKDAKSNTAVKRNSEYYNKGSDAIDDITFVAAEGYTGTVEIPFTACNGRSGSGSEVSGTLTIKVGKNKNAADITYSVDRNGTLELNLRDFNDYCKEATGSKSNLDYVIFTQPSSSKGTLYSEYSSSSRNTALKSSTRCYRDPDKSDVDLDEVVFVPASGYNGTVSVDFSGYNLDGNKFTGTMKITVGKGGGDIVYDKVPAGQAVTFDVDKFSSYCKDELDSKATLDFVTFDLPSSSKGTLYYDYSADSRNNTEVKSSTKYYRKGKPYLDQVTFVPARNVTGDVSINFYGESTSGDEFEGTLVITYNAIKDPGTIRYTSNGGQVPFLLRDFTAACDARGGAELDFVKFEIPDANYGKLYVDYISHTRNGGLISPSMSYGTGGNNSLSQISFIPKAGFSGTAVLYYTGSDKDGSTYRASVEITVTQPTVSATFSDVGANYNWAAPSVDYLYQAGIVTGTDTAGHFSPAANITRGDFVLMLYRAFNLRGSGSSSFTDVDPNAYYAQAIAAAQALDIAAGGGDGRFNPKSPLTRQDAMVLIQRTLNATGSTLRDGADTALNGFSDRGGVAPYAQGAVAALVQAGIIKGDDNGLLRPTGTLTRAEMATILHRVLTM